MKSGVLLELCKDLSYTVAISFSQQTQEFLIMILDGDIIVAEERDINPNVAIRKCLDKLGSKPKE